MTFVRGPNIDLLVSDAAMTLLGSPGSVLPALYALLTLHGRCLGRADYQYGPATLRVVPGRDGALLVGVPSDFAEEAA